MLWYEGGDISRILAMPRRGIICIDVETTGPRADRGDEILQLGIVDATGSTLLSGYVRPTHRKTWPAAQRVHGITPETVRGAPAMGDLRTCGQFLYDYGVCLKTIGLATIRLASPPTSTLHAGEGLVSATCV